LKNVIGGVCYIVSA